MILQNSAVEYNSMKQFKVDDGWLSGPASMKRSFTLKSHADDKAKSSPTNFTDRVTFRERFFFQIDNKIGSVKLNIRSRYKLKETKEVYKLNKSSKLFKLKVKKRKKKI